MAKAKPKKSKGLLGRAASLLGGIPAVGNVRNAAKKVGKATKLVKKTVKKATKKARKVVKSSKKKVKKTLKKAKKKAKKKRKKLRKKVGKVFTKARKLKNNLSKNKLVKKLKKKMKKTVLKAKKNLKKAKSTAKKVSKAVVKDSKKIMKKATLGARGIGEFTKNGFNGKEVASAIVDFIPIVGNAKGAYEAAFGKDPITGRKLDKTERAVAGASILLGGGFKGGTKVASGVISGGKKAAGKVPVPKKASNGDDFAKEPFLPDEYYKNNYAPQQGTPGARINFSRLGSSGQIEKSTVIYDQAGKQKIRIDYSDHGNARHHPNPPHLHEYTYQDAGKSIKDKYVYMFDPSTGRMRKSEVDKDTNKIKFID